MINTVVKIEKSKICRGYNVWEHIRTKIQNRFGIDIDDMDAHKIESTKVIKLADDALAEYARIAKCEPGKYEYYRVIVNLKT